MRVTTEELKALRAALSAAGHYRQVMTETERMTFDRGLATMAALDEKQKQVRKHDREYMAERKKRLQE